MRVRFDFKIRRLPILYRHRIMSLIKEALSLSNTPYKFLLYPEDLKRTKPFTFSVYILPGFETKQERFILDQDISLQETVFYPKREISLFVSSSEPEFIVNLYNGLLKLREFKLAEFLSQFGEEEPEYIHFVRAIVLNEKSITTDEAVFVTMSSLSLEDENDEPIDLLKDGQIDENSLKRFNYHLNVVQDKRFKDLRGYGLKKPLELVPKRMTKKVVKHALKGFRDQTGKPYMFLTTYQGEFKLKGDVEDLKLTYQVGLGLRTGQGFGMLEVV
ncbi:CRISPR-associated endoribonuclease Cas6 [Pseudothermotoga sp. U03pept]|uniref:CRISPR-associated endoribonuclease Cas6 n=1 Tax=Pseudothermotoga sp. U03pept TaxID=3447012 RepID=UPI003F0030E0